MLTQTGEYALRAMTFIGQRGPDTPASAKEIAVATGVSLKYLQKLLRDLVRAGLLASARGVRGGFRLARAPERLPLLEIIRPFDSSLRRPTCPFGNPNCGSDEPCPVHERWSRVVAAYRDFLENTTLSEVLGRL